jgi:hypothetical protein
MHIPPTIRQTRKHTGRNTTRNKYIRQEDEPSRSMVCELVVTARQLNMTFSRRSYIHVMSHCLILYGDEDAVR